MAVEKLEMKRSSWSPKMYVIEKTNLGHLLPVLGKLLVCDIEARHIARYQQKRLQEDAAPKTINLEVCRELRASRRTAGVYVILLTARNSAADIISGLRAGADDYVTKPVQAEELRARVQLGCRIIELRAALKIEVGALAVALAREKLLLNRLALIPERSPRRESRKGIASVV